MEKYSDTELKAMAFEVAHQLNLLKAEHNKIIKELLRRKAIETKVEVTPDELRDKDTK